MRAPDETAEAVIVATVAVETGVETGAATADLIVVPIVLRAPLVSLCLPALTRIKD
jgi:hypothetical protein